MGPSTPPLMGPSGGEGAVLAGLGPPHPPHPPQSASWQRHGLQATPIADFCIAVSAGAMKWPAFTHLHRAARSSRRKLPNMPREVADGLLTQRATQTNPASERATRQRGGQPERDA